MVSHPRRTTLRVDGDGVTRLESRGVRTILRLFALAVGLITLAVVVAVVAIRFSGGPTPGSVPPASAERPVPSSPPLAQHAPAPAAPGTVTKVTPRRKQTAPVGERGAADGDEATFTLPAPGEKTGIAVFPPPGTKPIKRGLVVPDDFELPPGYVRHHQTTDDGKQLPPILMFHPDYEFVDADGKPVRVPEDRIVPPGMAPPGLPIQELEIPTPEAPAGMRP